MTELVTSHSPAQNPIIVIVGPTGAGKSELAQCVATQLDGEIVSADSMQIYKGMDIGTAKVPPEKRRVPHYGLDLIDPGEPYSAALFQPYARACFKDIQKRGKQPILCGGTGFYVRAAIDDYEFPSGGQVDNPVRDREYAYCDKYGAQALWEKLNKIDPASASIIPPNNVKRVVRAFELIEDGTTYAEQKEKLASIPQVYPAIFIGLTLDREILYERINQRVDRMVADGLVSEVQNLIDAGFKNAVTAKQAIGYKEIAASFSGENTLEEGIEQIKQASRRYAKRQGTWFRKDKRINWIDITNLSAEQICAEAMKIIDTHKASC